MSTLLLRLAGPMQSWGDASRFNQRRTRTEPTKSGVLGLIAAAQGRCRSDNLEDLLQLRIGVRVDQPGVLVVDFQTEMDRKGCSLPLSKRHYLSDAVFVVGIEGDPQLLEAIREALQHPKFPLYLGRRSCPPSQPLILKLVDKPLSEAIMPEVVPWQAANWYRKSCEKLGYMASLTFDKEVVTETKLDTVETVHDIPISFSRDHRKYQFRDVIRRKIEMMKPVGTTIEKLSITEHDPLLALGGE